MMLMAVLASLTDMWYRYRSVGHNVVSLDPCKHDCSHANGVGSP
jgi:hypothetical protein